MTARALYQHSLLAAQPAPKPKLHNGGSNNPIVFHDYKSFVEKFSMQPKTTDDCYTPEDVYQAVVDYVGTVTDLEGRQILRPFYPGGDYLNAEYPADGIVIDNPPFSQFTKICKFYVRRGILFFLFAPGLTVGSIFNVCTAVIINTDILFSNKARVRINFASNLYGDTVAITAPKLDRAIAGCKSQTQRAELPKYGYPDEVCSVSQLQRICHGGVEFRIQRDRCERVRNLDCHPKTSGLFGDHLLLAKSEALAKAEAQRTIPIPLSPREQRIVERLGAQKKPPSAPIP